MSVFLKLFELKKKLEPVTKGSKGYNYNYADLAACHEVLDPILESLNLVWTTLPTSSDDGRVGVEYLLVDLDTGDRLEGKLLLPCPNGDPQKAGSAITYARRYALAAIGILTEEDDDGAKASKARNPTSNAVKAAPRRTTAKQEAKAFIPDGEKGNLIGRCQIMAVDAYPKNETQQQEANMEIGKALIQHMGVSSIGVILDGEYDKAWDFLQKFDVTKF